VAARLPQVGTRRGWLGQITDFDRPAPVVDGISAITGGVAMLFQGMNEAGDMLRVATSVRTAAGQRAISTDIPALQPDGTSNPTLAATLRGETYLGRAQVVGQWMATGYQPLFDDRKQVVGMLFVGLPEAVAGGGTSGSHSTRRSTCSSRSDSTRPKCRRPCEPSRPSTRGCFGSSSSSDSGRWPRPPSRGYWWRVT